MALNWNEYSTEIDRDEEQYALYEKIDEYLEEIEYAGAPDHDYKTGPGDSAYSVNLELYKADPEWADRYFDPEFTEGGLYSIDATDLGGNTEDRELGHNSIYFLSYKEMKRYIADHGLNLNIDKGRTARVSNGEVCPMCWGYGVDHNERKCADCDGNGKISVSYDKTMAKIIPVVTKSSGPSSRGNVCPDCGGTDLVNWKGKRKISPEPSRGNPPNSMCLDCDWHGAQSELLFSKDEKLVASLNRERVR